MKTLFLLFITCVFTFKVYAEENIILMADQAQEFSLDIGNSMANLAEEFKARSSNACELYQKLQYKLTHTKVIGDFKNSKRLQYRIDWYKNPEVDLFKICSPNFYSDIEYGFLMLHSRSMKRMRFN
jgi:hypothetical protein